MSQSTSHCSNLEMPSGLDLNFSSPSPSSHWLMHRAPRMPLAPWSEVAMTRVSSSRDPISSPTMPSR